MTRELDRLKAAIAGQIGPNVSVFAPGGPRKAVLSTLATTSLRLPRSYLDFLCAADGAQVDSKLVFPPGQLRLLSAAKAAALWSDLRVYADEDDEFFETTGDDGRVRALVFDPRRFPVAYDESASQYLFIDLIPGPKGTRGQIIFNPSEATFEVIAPDFKAWLDSISTMLDANRARVVAIPPEFGSGFWFETPDGRPLTYSEYRACQMK